MGKTYKKVVNNKYEKKKLHNLKNKFRPLIVDEENEEIDNETKKLFELFNKDNDTNK